VSKTLRREFETLDDAFGRDVFKQPPPVTDVTKVRQAGDAQKRMGGDDATVRLAALERQIALLVQHVVSMDGGSKGITGNDPDNEGQTTAVLEDCESRQRGDEQDGQRRDVTQKKREARQAATLCIADQDQRRVVDHQGRPGVDDVGVVGYGRGGDDQGGRRSEATRERQHSQGPSSTRRGIDGQQQKAKKTL